MVCKDRYFLVSAPENADSTYMRMVTVLVASMFIIVGIITLLKIF